MTDPLPLVRENVPRALLLLPGSGVLINVASQLALNLRELETGTRQFELPLEAEEDDFDFSFIFDDQLFMDLAEFLDELTCPDRFVAWYQHEMANTCGTMLDFARDFYAHITGGRFEYPPHSALLRQRRMKSLDTLLTLESHRQLKKICETLDRLMAGGPALVLPWVEPMCIYRLRGLPEGKDFSEGQVDYEDIVFPAAREENVFAGIFECFDGLGRKMLRSLEAEYERPLDEADLADAEFFNRLQNERELRGAGDHDKFFIRLTGPDNIRVGVDFDRRPVLIQANLGITGKSAYVYYDLARRTEAWIEMPAQGRLREDRLFNQQEYRVSSRETAIRYHFFAKPIETDGQTMTCNFCIGDGAARILQDFERVAAPDPLVVERILLSFERVFRYGHHSRNTNTYFNPLDKVMHEVGPSAYRRLFVGAEAEAAELAAGLGAELVRMKRS